MSRECSTEPSKRLVAPSRAGPAQRMCLRHLRADGRPTTTCCERCPRGADGHHEKVVGLIAGVLTGEALASVGAAEGRRENIIKVRCDTLTGVANCQFAVARRLQYGGRAEEAPAGVWSVTRPLHGNGASWARPRTS